MHPAHTRLPANLALTQVRYTHLIRACQEDVDDGILEYSFNVHGKVLVFRRISQLQHIERILKP